MELSKQKKEFLLALCKKNNIKGYSKLKKEELITKLAEIGVVSASDNGDDDVVPADAAASPKVKPASKPRDIKPRQEKLSKKLEKYISCNDYEKDLSKFTNDVDDKSIFDLVKTNTSSFITSDTLLDVDYKKYVDDYGVMKALVEFLDAKPNAILIKITGEKIYYELALFLYAKDDDIYSGLVKKFKNFTLATIKKAELAASSIKPAPKKKAAPKKKTSDVEDIAEEESEEESEEEDVAEVDDNSDDEN